MNLSANPIAIMVILDLFEKNGKVREKEAFLRQLHTFKGNGGFFGFQGTQEDSPDFEYALSDCLILGTEIPYQDLYFNLKKSYYQELRTTSEILGQDWLKDVGVSSRTFGDFGGGLPPPGEPYVGPWDRTLR